MAVYTKISEDELKKFFLKYSLGKLLEHKEIKEGIENTNYFIRTYTIMSYILLALIIAVNSINLLSHSFTFDCA